MKTLQLQIAKIYEAIQFHRECIEKGGSHFYHNNQIEALSQLVSEKENQLNDLN